MWCCLCSIGGAQSITEHRLFLAPGEMWPGKIFALQILPTGEIRDLYQQYTTTRWVSDISITPNKKFMYISADIAIDEFKIESHGNLFTLGTFTCPGVPGDIGITPNNDMVIVGIGDSNPPGFFLEISTTGELIDTYYRASTGIWINPRGNPIMYGGFLGESVWVFHLDYSSGTIFHTQVIPGVCNSPKGMAFTPDGSLGILVGYLGGLVDVRAFKIDTTESVSTIGQWNIGGTAKDVQITPDARFALIAVDSVIAVFAIDTHTGTVTDTGKRFSPPTRPPTYQALPHYLRITDDGKMVVVNYDVYGENEIIGTGWIDSEGNITWTGYTFPFGNTYVPGATAVMDMELVPAVQVTGLDSSQWQLYD